MPDCIYSVVSWTTILEPLSAILIVMSLFLDRLIRVLYCCLLRLGCVCGCGNSSVDVFSAVMNSSIWVCPRGACQALFDLKGCGM